MKLRDWGLLVLLSLLWGASFFFVELGLEALSPLSLVTYRVGIAALLLFALIAVAGLWRPGLRLPLSPATWGVFLAMGALNNALPFTLITLAQRELDSGLAAILNATTPFWTMLLAHIMTHDEKITLLKSAGILLGIVGVTVIALGGRLGLGSEDNGLAYSLGALGLMLCATLSYALAGITGRRLRSLSPLTASCGMLLCSAAIMVVTTIAMEGGIATPASVTDWQVVIGIAVLCTACAYPLYFTILSSAGATNLLLVTLLIPPGALLLGAVALGESITGPTLAGLALILTGLLIIDKRLLRFAAQALPHTRRPLAKGDHKQVVP